MGFEECSWSFKGVSWGFKRSQGRFRGFQGISELFQEVAGAFQVVSGGCKAFSWASQGISWDFKGNLNYHGCSMSFSGAFGGFIRALRGVSVGSNDVLGALRDFSFKSVPGTYWRVSKSLQELFEVFYMMSNLFGEFYERFKQFQFRFVTCGCRCRFRGFHGRFRKFVACTRVFQGISEGFQNRYREFHTISWELSGVREVPGVF